jgi:hypothetical protein
LDRLPDLANINGDVLPAFSPPAINDSGGVVQPVSQREMVPGRLEQPGQDTLPDARVRPSGE